MGTHNRTIPTNVRMVLGYVRVSTDEQADSGAGLAAQRASIPAECDRRGWTLLAVYDDAGASGKSMAGRAGPQLRARGSRGRRRQAAGHSLAFAMPSLTEWSQAAATVWSLMYWTFRHPAS